MTTGEEASKALTSPVNSMSVGRVDWSPLAKATGTRPLVSKYGLARYSPMEWRLANDAVIGNLPSAAALDNESKNIIAQVASACDKEQSENTLRLRQRAVEVRVNHMIASDYCEELKNEVEQMAQYKLRIRKALEYLGVVEEINAECREIRKNRLTEDLIRDEVEEELFQEKGLCQEIRQLYNATLDEFENQYQADKKCYQEIHSIWSDQKETLEQEAENIGLKSSSQQISFVHGIARHDENMSTLEIWNNYMVSVLKSIKDVIENSKALRKRIQNPILTDSARDLKKQGEKVMKALLKRIEEITHARKRLEKDLEQVLHEIAHAERLYGALEKIGRQLDFNLKVVQTRLENRRHRPGAENCRDASQMGLLEELKIISERVTSIETQMKKISDTIELLYASRKKLEKDIHIKRHSLNLDQERCMRYRSRYPNIAYLMGF